MHVVDPPSVEALTRAVARVVLEGFDRHYSIFREVSRAAKDLFERGDWDGMARLVTTRIDFYDLRVEECVERLRTELPTQALDERIWGDVKLAFVGLLTSHKQPELAETFFNSVSCRILERTYYKNQFIFVRPSISTEYMDSDPPSYRSYYPTRDGIKSVIRQVIRDFDLKTPFADLGRDLFNLLRMVRLVVPRPVVFGPNHQIQVLSSLFFRGSAAYVVGKVINGDLDYPFAVPILRDEAGLLYLDTLILEPDHLAILFSASRAYFLVEMDVPATYVEFLKGLMPSKPKWELYTILGLQKAGKNLFYRDFLHHLRHSSDSLTIAPGIKGLVMVVFTLPSYPYVFKVVRDRPEPPKEVDRAIVREKYRLVKHHDRAGRMADTLEYSDVAFPRHRFTPELLTELRALVPSLIEIEEDTVFIRHLYIERRMVPLNLYLEQASDAEVEGVVQEYGDTLKELAATNIFPGDLLFKNFGVTRLGRVVFYDYDEIDYLTGVVFRDLPKPRNEEDELAAEPWFAVGPKDVFPEELAPFLLGDPRVRSAFMKRHAELLDPRWWRDAQEQVRQGRAVLPLPYPRSIRFERLFGPGARRLSRLPRRPRLQSLLSDPLAGVGPD
ncbi:MAG: bifunctional isocitrate dehydrogenase kinase/phosphatase [Deltaproteobacteria bacterium]|nr:bifunctional isocitrate dehydrogenase kinase/phosphatase [Deltaproteobacteria bacterium]